LLTIDRNALPNLLEQQGYGEAVIELANMPMHAALPLRPPMDVDMCRQLNPDDLQHPDGERFARITHLPEFRKSIWTPSWSQPDPIWRVQSGFSTEPVLRGSTPGGAAQVTEVSSEASNSRDVVSGVSSAQGDAMVVDWAQQVAMNSVPKSSVPVASLYKACPYKAPPPGFESGHVLIAPAVLQRVAGEPTPKQARRMSLEAISEAAVRSTPEESTEAVAEDNSVEPAPEPSAAVDSSYLGQPSGNADYEPMLTPDDLEPVTPL